jgi:putative membrane protein
MSEPTETMPTPKPTGPTYATDHLANERTFLAWVRTSLAVIGLGFAVAKFGTWLRELAGQPAHLAEASRGTHSFAVGIVMISTGGAFAIIAALRHRAVARQIEDGRVRSASTTVAVVTVIILILAVAVGGLTFTGPSR